MRRDELGACPVFISDAAGDFHALLRGFFAGDDVPGPVLEATGSVEGVKRAVATEPDALGVLPTYAVADDIASGQAVPVPIRPHPPRMRLVAILPASRPRHPSIDGLLDALRNEAAASSGSERKRR